MICAKTVNTTLYFSNLQTDELFSTQLQAKIFETLMEASTDSDDVVNICGFAEAARTIGTNVDLFRSLLNNG